MHRKSQFQWCTAREKREELGGEKKSCWRKPHMRQNSQTSDGGLGRMAASSYLLICELQDDTP